MKSKSVIFIFLIFLSVNVEAQFWKAITNTFSSLLNTGIKITTAPYQATFNAVKAVTNGGSASDIYKPYQQVAASAGSSLQDGAKLISTPENYFFQEALDFSNNTGGLAGTFIFDVGTFFNQYCYDLGNAATQNVGGVLQGQNPFEIFATPLAAAVRAAREREYPNSLPIPDDVKKALSPYFDQAILNKARYAIGTIEITLPNFIGQGAKFMEGEDYAVTVDDIIVFNKDPGSFSNSPNWWAHEMTHVRQYSKFGIDEFAFYYLRDLGHALESEAIDNAQNITQIYANSTYVTTRKSFDQSGNPNYALSQYDLKNNPEYYVAQCFLPQYNFGALYLITNYSRIIAVNPMDGAWQQIGYITPPLLYGVGISCSFWVPNSNIRLAIGYDGGIYVTTTYVLDIYNHIVVDQYGQPMYNWKRIGYVQKFQ